MTGATLCRFAWSNGAAPPRADPEEDDVRRPRGHERRQEVGARERQRHVVDDEIAGHDGDGEADAEEPAAARRLQRQRDGDEDHHEVHERKGELGIERDQVFLGLEAGGFETRHVVAQLPVAHRLEVLVDPRELLDVLVELEGGERERHRLHGAAGLDLAEGAVAQLPARLRPVRLPGVEPVEQPELAVHLQNRHPVEVARPGTQELDAIEAAVRAAEPQPLARLEVAGELAPDLHAVHLLAQLVQARQEQLLEEHRAHGHRQAHQEHGRAHTVETDAGGLHRGQLVEPAQREKQKDRRHEHDDRQSLVERRRQPVEKVLEDVDERRLDAQEPVERLSQVDDDVERRRHREPDAEEGEELAHEIAVEDVRRVGGAVAHAGRPRRRARPRHQRAERVERPPGEGETRRPPLAGRGHEQREPDDRERDVRCPDGDPGGDALAQGGPLQRRQEHVVRDEDHQAPGERDGPAAAM